MLQTIIIIETTSACRSDYQYIKSVLDYYYVPRSFSIEKVFAKTKTELIKQDKKIDRAIRNYDGVSEVVVCADVDSNDQIINSKIENYCKSRGYHVVWMNKDVESVMLGHPVSDKEKCREAFNFLKKSQSIIPALQNLSNNNALAVNNTSNLLVVFDKFLKRK